MSLESTAPLSVIDEKCLTILKFVENTLIKIFFAISKMSIWHGDLFYSDGKVCMSLPQLHIIIGEVAKVKSDNIKDLFKQKPVSNLFKK